MRDFTGQRPRTTYTITDEGRTSLREWLDRPAASRSAEFEGMLKVFFADGGSLEQLTATLRAIEAEASGKLAELRAVNAQNLAGGSRFPKRLHLSVMALRMHEEQEIAIEQWARWAQEQILAWRDTTDPGDWDIAAAERETDQRSRTTTTGGEDRPHVAV